MYNSQHLIYMNTYYKQLSPNYICFPSLASPTVLNSVTCLKYQFDHSVLGFSRSTLYHFQKPYSSKLKSELSFTHWIHALSSESLLKRNLTTIFNFSKTTVNTKSMTKRHTHVSNPHEPSKKCAPLHRAKTGQCVLHITDTYRATISDMKITFTQVLDISTYTLEAVAWCAFSFSATITTKIRATICTFFSRHVFFSGSKVSVLASFLNL